MSYIDDLKNAAARANVASDRADKASKIIHDVSHGDELTSVNTENGSVDSVAKAIKKITDEILAGVSQAMSETEKHVLTTDTDTVTLTSLTNHAIVVYVEGSREFSFTKSGDYTIIFDNPLPAGTTVYATKGII